MYLGPLVSEKKLAAEQAKAEDVDRNEKGEGEDEDKDKDSKAEEEEGEGAGGSGGSRGSVDGTTAALEQMSATGREELARSESAGTDS